MKRAVLMCGLLLLCLIWAGPLLVAYRESFAAHMLAHMGVVAIAAPLIAIGLAGTRWDFSGWSKLFSPVPASLLELVVVWVWHSTALRSAAQASLPVTIVEQASFLVAGLVLWMACVGNGSGQPQRAKRGRCVRAAPYLCPYDLAWRAAFLECLDRSTGSKPLPASASRWTPVRISRPVGSSCCSSGPRSTWPAA